MLCLLLNTKVEDSFCFLGTDFDVMVVYHFLEVGLDLGEGGVRR